MEIKYKFEAVAVTSGLFMLLTAYALPVATYFEPHDHVPIAIICRDFSTSCTADGVYGSECPIAVDPYSDREKQIVLKQSFIYYRCFQDLAVQLLLPLVLQMLIPTYAGDNNDDGSILFWILDIVEYLMYFTTIFLTRRVITLLKLI